MSDIIKSRVFRAANSIKPIRELSDGEIVAVPAGQWQRLKNELTAAILSASESGGPAEVIKKLHAKGESNPTIADLLNSMGITTRNGGAWTANTVATHLRAINKAEAA